MDRQADFDALVAMAMAIPGRAHMRPVIEKELLHYDLLFCLDQEGILDQLTFQGGTSLRLCHGYCHRSKNPPYPPVKKWPGLGTGRGVPPSLDL